MSPVFLSLAVAEGKTNKSAVTEFFRKFLG